MIERRLPNKETPQSGNILIYILGAIFLLGLLVVIARGSSTPGAGIDAETLIIRIAEVQEYGKELERAVGYIMANGNSESDIRFAHPDASSAYGDITDIPTRQVFSRQGGGAQYRQPAQGIQTTPTDWLFTAENRVDQVGSNTNNPSSADLIALLQNVSEEFCRMMNDRNGIENPSNAPPQNENDVEITALFDGTYDNTELIRDTGTHLTQNLEGCFEGSGTPPDNTFHYYRVLLAR